MQAHYFTVAGLTTVGFSTENDSGTELTALTTEGATETLAGRYTVDVTEGVTVNWYEGATFIVSERANEIPLTPSAYVAPDNAGIAAIPTTPLLAENYTAPDNASAQAAAASAASADGKLTAGRLGKLDSLTFTTPGTVDAAVAEPDLGTDTCTLTINDENGDPVTDARVYVSSDVAGARHSRTKITDGLGQAAFDLTDGETYYRWAFSSTVEFTNPQAFVAVAD